MSKTMLIITDLVFIAAIPLLFWGTGGKLSLPLTFLLISAFVSCVVRHANYYKQTKRIY